MRGRIIRGIAGFYYVQTGNQIYECKAKGIFRKDKKKPLPGDYVEIDILDEAALTANISVILPRTNELIVLRWPTWIRPWSLWRRQVRLRT